MKNLSKICLSALFFVATAVTANAQHKVEKFELEDEKKNGNRNILVFFLIDPRKKVISTADIVSNEMTPKEAKIYRELLMFQRKYKVKDQESFFERGWSLCEH